MNYSDEEIVKQVLTGDKEFYAMLVDRYQRPVYNLMYRYTNNSEEAADLTQDVFFKAFNKLRSFRSDKRFFSWLYKLALNHAGDWVRKRNSSRSYQNSLRQESRQHEDAGQQDQIELREELQQVNSALLRLPSHFREILILRYRHGQTIYEVAKVFDLSESAAKMRIKRGLEQLRTIIEAEVRVDKKV